MNAELIHELAAARPRVRRLALKPQHLPLAAILALAACLDFWNLSQNAYANTYYAGAVRSMLRSWHNFFFVSFDPGGLVSVDKPPLALWLQAASAKVFGFSSFSILLPEALAGVGAVWLLYLLVTRYFGRVAGLAAALALAVSPVAVSVNRDNNPDALLALLLVASVYFGAGLPSPAGCAGSSARRCSSGSPSTRRCWPQWSSSRASRSPTSCCRGCAGACASCTLRSPRSCSRRYPGRGSRPST